MINFNLDFTKLLSMSQNNALFIMLLRSLRIYFSDERYVQESRYVFSVDANPEYLIKTQLDSFAGIFQTYSSGSKACCVTREHNCNRMPK